MGLGGISIWQLLIILAIVVMLFGTKKLRSMGGDLGEAIKGFRNSVKDDKDGEQDDEEKTDAIAEKDKEGEAVAAAKTEHEEK